MTDTNRFLIKLDAAGRGNVEMNGKPLPGLRALEFRAAVGEVTTVNLTLIGEVEVEAEAETVVAQPAARAAAV